MAFKIVFLDIDGTLFSHKTHSIPGSTILALNKAKENGVKICINTGRCYYFAKQSGLLDLFPFDYLVLSNGAVILDNNYEVVIENSISEDIIIKLINMANKENLNLCLMDNKDAFIINNNIEIAHLTLDPLSIGVPRVKNYQKEKINMVNLYSNNLNDDEVHYLLKPFLNKISYIRYNPWGFDLTRNDINKAVGIKLLVDKLNIDIKDSIAIGDGPNDIEMLSEAGLGIAMGNASDFVKKHADYVTTDIDEDGIYNAFKHFKII